MFGQKDTNQNQPFQDNNGAPAPDNSVPPNNFFNPATAPVPQVAGNDITAPVSDDSSVVMPNEASTAAPTNDHLISMKQEALQQLTPLVQHLDQTPEEKFRTVMMMIQASDDHSKLSEAFELAKQITDDKVRAQALLDVINEINYFTQQHNS